jgi:Domain of unknown function (DUF4126)
MGIIQTLGLAFGSAWVSGINLYAMVASLGLLGRFGGLRLPGELALLTNGWVIGVAVVLYCIEFVADKVPWVDSIWDLVHTFIRVPAGAVVAAAAFGDFNKAIQIIAFMVGGGLALSSHATKAATRAALNLSPEPFTNILASIIEDVVAVITMVFVAFAPIIVLCLLAVFLIVMIWLLPKILRFAKLTVSRVIRFFRGTAPNEVQLAR